MKLLTSSVAQVLGSMTAQDKTHFRCRKRIWRSQFSVLVLAYLCGSMFYLCGLLPYSQLAMVSAMGFFLLLTSSQVLAFQFLWRLFQLNALGGEE